MPAPPSFPSPDSGTRVPLEVLSSIKDAYVASFAEWWDDVCANWWSPVHWADATARLTSRNAGLPIDAMFAAVKAACPVPKKSKVMTPEQAWDCFIEAQKDYTKFVTNTDEAGLVEVAIAWAMRRIYRAGKMATILRALLGIKSVEEFLAWGLAYWKSTAFKRLLLTVVGVLFLLNSLAFCVWFAVGSSLVPEEYAYFEKHTLAQDSGRGYGTRKGRYRTNKQPGQDT